MLKKLSRRYALSFQDRQGLEALILLFLMVLPAFSSCAHRKEGIYHHVKRGETLWRISRSYGISLDEIKKANRIKDPSRIYAGQRLFIPKVRDRAKKKAIRKGSRAMDRKRFLWPVYGKITSRFGMRNGVIHKGIDISAPEGTAVLASDEGVVIYSGNTIRSYGNMIIIKHKGGFSTIYAHNKINLVKEKDRVKRGQKIAQVGATGNAKGPHLHFEIRKNNKAKDPLLFLP